MQGTVSPKNKTNMMLTYDDEARKTAHDMGGMAPSKVKLPPALSNRNMQNRSVDPRKKQTAKLLGNM